MDKHRLRIGSAMKLRPLRSLHLVPNRIERRLLASWDIGSTITVTVALPQKTGGEPRHRPKFSPFFSIEDTAECLKKNTERDLPKLATMQTRGLNDTD